MRPGSVKSFAALLVSALLLAGCAANGGGGSSKELRTSSDQTDSQKRASIRLQLAVSYYQQGQYQVALDEIKKALVADPNLSSAHSMRGLIYMNMGEKQLAEENFLQALRLAPNDPDVANNYGWFLCQNGREKQALSYFESALKNSTYQSPVKALNNAGTCSMKLKDGAAAERYFDRAFREDPSNPVTNFNLASIYYGRGDYERSRFYVKRVLNANIMTADVLWLAIKTERKLGDRTTETSLATQLGRRYPTSPEFGHYQRGAFDE